MKILVIMLRNPKGMNTMPEEGYVIGQDGQISTMYHNGEHMILEHYQDRLELPNEESIWDQLGAGKMYIEDYYEEHWITYPMINEAMSWHNLDTSSSIDYKVMISDSNVQQEIKDFVGMFYIDKEGNDVRDYFDEADYRMEQRRDG